MEVRGRKHASLSQRNHDKAPLFQVGIEPGQGALDYVAAVLGIGEHVAFVFVDYELRFDAERFEGVPEFVGLRGGDFAVAVADENERRSFYFFDEIDRRAFGVDLGVVVNGFAEERDHPLVDEIFAVVALPVGETGAGHGGFEAVGLRDGPHGHVAAVAPAADTEAIRIDGRDFDGFVDAGHDVLEVAVAKILDVGASERLALAEAAARIRLQDEIAGAGEGRIVIGCAGPFGEDGGAGTAVNADDQRIFFVGIEIARVEKPALDFESAVFPVDTFGFAPSGLDGFVALRDLCPVGGGAGPNFGRGAERAANHGGRFCVAGEREIDSPSPAVI